MSEDKNQTNTAEGQSELTAKVRCADCGAENYHTNYSKSERKTLMDKLGICFTCAYWRVEVSKPHSLVIGGRIYGLGNGTEGGMGGRKFDIEYFDGRKITTNDLWAGSDAPDRYKDQIPDTARFVNGAKECKSGETTCWNPST